MTYYREWALRPDQRRGCMLPARVVARFCNAPDAGYASVYLFSKQDAEEVIASRSSAGLARFSVHSATLTLDLDRGAEQLAAVQAKVADLEYAVFESGGKGFHVVITLDSMVSGKNVPYSQRKWAEDLNVEADLSLYQAGHIIALPGRVHPKTGKRKLLISAHPGNRLALPLIDKPAPVFALRDDNQCELERGIWRVLGLLQSGPGPGGRHTALWGAAKHFADAGLGPDTALDLLWAVNLTWDEPKTPEEVRRAVSQAYGAPTT